MPPQTRPITGDELLQSFRSAVASLAIALSRFRPEVDRVVADQQAVPDGEMPPRPVYDYGPIEDVAVKLRKLLLAGRGDDLFRRATDAAAAEPPSIKISAPAVGPGRPGWPKYVVEFFSSGALPETAGDPGAPKIPITEIHEVVCLQFVTKGRAVEAYTWGRLIKEVADKGAVHTDDERPVAWDHLDEYHIGVVPTIPFMLYRLGTACVEAGNEVLEAAHLPTVDHDNGHHLAGMVCYAMQATETGRRPGPKPGRNDPCDCGSGQKFKYCCN